MQTLTPAAYLMFIAAVGFGCVPGGGGGTAVQVAGDGGVVQPGPGPGGTVSADFRAFMGQVPRALCERYAACGQVPDAEVESCAAELGEEMARDNAAECAAAAEFYAQHRAAIEACLLRGEGAVCEGDDLDQICPVFADFDDDACRASPPPGGEPPDGAPTAPRCTGSRTSLAASAKRASASWHASSASRRCWTWSCK